MVLDNKDQKVKNLSERILINKNSRIKKYKPYG